MFVAPHLQCGNLGSAVFVLRERELVGRAAVKYNVRSALPTVNGRLLARSDGVVACSGPVPPFPVSGQRRGRLARNEADFQGTLAVSSIGNVSSVSTVMTLPAVLSWDLQLLAKLFQGGRGDVFDGGVGGAGGARAWRERARQSERAPLLEGDLIRVLAVAARQVQRFRQGRHLGVYEHARVQTVVWPAAAAAALHVHTHT